MDVVRTWVGPSTECKYQNGVYVFLFMLMLINPALAGRAWGRVHSYDIWGRARQRRAGMAITVHVCAWSEMRRGVGH